MRNAASIILMAIACAMCPGRGTVAAAERQSGEGSTRLDRSRYMGVEQIQRGMTGIGRTVLEGSQRIEFQATVVDVIHNWGPKQDVILVRLSGANLEHSGIIRGMSGSPIYLKDPEDGDKLKMIGAIAYGWSWNKDPVGGVQPIEQMLSVRGFAGKAAAEEATRKPATMRGKRLGVQEGHSGGPKALPGPLDPNAESRYVMMGFPAASNEPMFRDHPVRSARSSDLRPLSTPLLVGTTNPRVMEYVRGWCGQANLFPLQAGGGGAAAEDAPAQFEPGGSLVVPFLLGDLDMAGVGTVTEVVGDQVLGFGHAMMAEGPVELPMATGVVHTPISLLTASFKLASTGKVIGTLRGDEETGVWGISGDAPKMIPTRLNITDPAGRRVYEYQATYHRRMTPFILGTGLGMGVLANRDLPLEHTLRYTIRVEYEKLGAFTASNLSSMRWLYDMQNDLVDPMSILLDNDFGQARVRSVDIRVAIEPEASICRLERADLSRSEYKPGETVEVDVWWRAYRAEPFRRQYTLTLPSDLENGKYELIVGSSRSHLTALRSEKPHRFRSESLAELADALREVAQVRNDRLYMRLQVKRGGVALGKTEMPDLPSFRKQILGDAEIRPVQPYAEPILVEHPIEFVASGEKRFAVQVNRRADQ